MKFAKKLSLLVSLAAAAACSANAVDARAKFTLPHETRVGAGVLPAGEYTVTMSVDGTTKAFIAPADRGGVSLIVLPMVTDSHATCAESSLSLERFGSVWNLRSVCFAEPQMSLYFPVPAEIAAEPAVAADNSAIAAAK